MLYSASTGGFYRAELHGTAIPADAVEISAARHAQLLAAQAAGAAIVAGADGRPRALADRLTLADRRLAAIVGVKAEAGRRIDAFAPLWRQVNDLADPTSPAAITRRARIDAIRGASDQIEAAIAHMTAADLDALDLRSHPLWPEEA